jgi:hypothetical protein
VAIVAGAECNEILAALDLSVFSLRRSGEQFAECKSSDQNKASSAHHISWSIHVIDGICWCVP